MLGGELLRELAAGRRLRGTLHCTDQDTWSRAGDLPSGEQVWERTFSLGKAGILLVVTVLVDGPTCSTRTFYTARVSVEDDVPRIPSAVRRQVEAFARSFEAG